MKGKILFGIITSCFIVQTKSNAQMRDSVKFDYEKIYSFCLDGDVKSALPLLQFDTLKKISNENLSFVKEFNARFGFDKDKSSYLTDKTSSIDGILIIFQNYWRQSLLDVTKDNDSILWNNLGIYLSQSYPSLKKSSTFPDSVDLYMKKYIASKGLFMTDGIGKTGRLFDLLVWKAQKDTLYKFQVHNEIISARVILMDNFITLGWEEYATLGKYYPGGWATKEALYCVKSAYDLNSEDFLISYLTHESRHFADYKLFPNIESADLEYRAKLTELSLAKKTLFDLIYFFIDNANNTSKNGHTIANYRVINDLSKKIFKTEFEKDKKKWVKVKPERINNEAFNLLQENTRLLQKGN